MERVAAIDLGSNTCVLLLLERRDGRLHRLTSEIAFTRLAAGLDGAGHLSVEAVERSLEALRRFCRIAEKAGAQRLACVATAALREAPNRALLVDAAAQFGLQVTPISGAEEAALSFAAVASAESGPLLVLDIGGASSELSAGEGGVLDWRRSLAIGSVRLHERYRLGVPLDPAAAALLNADLDAGLAALPQPPDGAELVAVAGTAVSAAQCHLGLLDYDHSRLDGVTLEAAAISDLIDRIGSCDLDERMQRFSLPPGRADVFPAGLMILAAILRWSAAPRLLVRDRGVAWGAALRLLT